MKQEHFIQRKIKILKDFLAQKGFKSTRQRNAIIDVFARLEDQLNAEEIYRIVKKKIPEIGFTTVYRTIKLIEKSGFVKRSHLGDGFTRFEPEFSQKNRIHLRCSECGELKTDEETDLALEATKLAREKNYQLYSYKIELTGLCQLCQRPMQ